MQYFLSLGSNINAQKNIKFAVSELQEIFLDLKSSSTHQTKAEGFEGEDFLNLVTSGTSLLSFEALNESDEVKKYKFVSDPLKELI
jgi:2-amino-4-hydroxy-6-hydroxymethyldihydropteridine diphosphokinase